MRATEPGREATPDEERLDVVTVGECMVELYGEEAVSEEPMLKCTVGGDTLNVATTVARLGGKAGFVTRVGDDIFAPLLLGRWDREGIDLSAVRIVPGFNGLYVITVQPDGERSFTYYRRGDAASTLEPSDIPAEYIARAAIVHTSGITQAISHSARASVRHLVAVSRRLGVKVSFDPNFRPKLWPAAQARLELHAILPGLYAIFPSANEEEAALWGTSRPDLIADTCLQAGCQVVAVKMGADGCYVATPDAAQHIPAVSCYAVRDTTGAGDAFDGAFLFALARQADPTDAARLASLVAAMKCAGRGALGNLPRRGEVQQAWREVYGCAAPTWLEGD